MRATSPKNCSIGCRRGLSQAATLVWIGLTAIGAVTTVAVVPRFVRAAVEMEVPHPEAAGHQRTIDALAAIIAASREVLVVTPVGPDGRQEVALWVPRGDEAIYVDASDVLVLFFSPTLEVVTAHSLVPGASGSSLTSVRLDPEALTSHNFPQRFRSYPGVERRVIAPAIRSMRLSAQSDRASPGATLRLELTFSAESADGEATVVRTLRGVRLRS